MSIREILAANPILQRLRAKGNFIAVVAIPLRDWKQLWDAEGWCERRWEDYDRQYRRRTREEDCVATFVFPNLDDAAEFLLRFG